MTTIVTRAGKGSALTWVEGDANFTNLNTDKIENLVEDLTPQLGGDLDVNDFAILSNSANGLNIWATNPDANIGISSLSSGISINETAIELVTSASSSKINLATVDANIELTLYNPLSNTGRIKLGGYVWPLLTEYGEGPSGTITSIDDSNQTIFLSNTTGLNPGNKITFTGSDISPIGLIPNQQYNIVMINGNEIIVQYPGTPINLVNIGTITDANYTTIMVVSQPQNDQVLTTDQFGNLSWTTPSAGSGSDLVNDTTPQLGGNLDVNSFSITSTTNQDINITPNGTGRVVLSGYKFPTNSASTITGSVTAVDIVRNPNTLTLSPYAGIAMNDIIVFSGTGVTGLGLAVGVQYKIWAGIGSGAFEIALASGGGTITLADPGTITDVNFSVTGGSTVTNGQVLTYNNTGLTWSTISSGITSLSQDPNPMLGGNLNLNNFSITSTNNQNISIIPNGSGHITLGSINWPIADGTTNQVLTTDGAGNLSFQPPSATIVKDLVMNQTGSTIPKGYVVYITGANGDNPLISLAQANSESTSSKTLGFTMTQMSQGASGYVITNGLLEGIDTSTATIGDPVWLSPTTPGWMVFGLANKPVAPNHMVYLGVVVRVNQNNGAISVKVQNGYELDELHNVSSATPSNNDVLTYITSTGLWTPVAGGSGGGLSDIVNDLTPQLGGNLDVNSFSIVSVSNGNIMISPNGSGNVMITPNTGQIILGSTNWPTSMPSTGQVLTAGSGGVLSWATPSTSVDLSSPGPIGSTTPSTIAVTTLTFKDTREAVYGLGTTGGTIAPNCANGTVQSITLNAALTINGFTSPVAGQSLTLIINGGTAYTSITSTMKFAGGIKTLTGTASCIDILTVFYDGTNYYASIGKGFA